MTASQNTTTHAAKVLPVEIVYQVKGLRHGTRRVSVTPAGAYHCDCPSAQLFAECEHTDAVKARRKGEGRKF